MVSVHPDKTRAKESEAISARVKLFPKGLIDGRSDATSLPIGWQDAQAA
jgi:hypothetical protein